VSQMERLLIACYYYSSFGRHIAHPCQMLSLHTSMSSVQLPLATMKSELLPLESPPFDCHRQKVISTSGFDCHVCLHVALLAMVKDRINNDVVLLSVIFLYGSECWAVTKRDALDQWCLRKLLGIKWYHHMWNDEVRRTTGQPRLSAIVQAGRLSCLAILQECQTRQMPGVS